MENFGREVGRRAQVNLRRAIVSCLVIVSGGAYMGFMPVASAGCSWTGNWQDPEGGGVLTCYGGGDMGWGGSGGWSGGGSDTDNLGYYAPPIISDLPDTDIKARNASDDGRCAGNPVVLATGNKVEYEVDFETATSDELGVRRAYNHYSQQHGIFGFHWRSNHDYSVIFSDYDPGACVDIGWGIQDCDKTKARTIVAIRPDGKEIKYRRGSDGVYRAADAGSSTYMQWNAQRELVYQAEGLGVEVYARDSLDSSYISRRTDKFGAAWIYEGDAWLIRKITHSSGRSVELTWDMNNLTLSSIKDPSGKIHNYAYRPHSENAYSILTKYTQPDVGKSVTYHYENPTFRYALTGKSYGTTRYSTFSYDPNGRVSSTEHAGGVDKFLFSYESGEGYDDEGWSTWFNTKVTNPLGKVETHRHVNGRPIGVLGQASTYCPATAVSTTYDANKHVDKETDANGIVTDYDYDAKGRLIKKVEALGRPEARTTTYVWETNFDRLVNMTVQGEVRVEYTYGSDNRVTRMRSVNLSPNGVLNQVRDINYSYTKHANGLLSTMTQSGPVSGSTLKRTYAASGHLLSIENSLGHKTTFSAHNGLGLPGRVVNPNGGTTDYVYDALGRVYTSRELRDGAWADTQIRYTAPGDIASVTDPSGSRLSYEYGASRRLNRIYRDTAGILEGSGVREERSFTYDAAGNRTIVVDKLDGTIKSRAYFDYDELGRVRAIRGNNGQRTSYTYDKVGNLLTESDSENRPITYTYDGLRRVLTMRDRLNNTSSYVHDASNRVVRVTDSRSLVTTYKYDGFGSLWSQQSPDTGLTKFAYVASGLRTSMTRADNAQTTFAYDAMGRLISIVAGAQSHTFTWDNCTNGKGLPCRIADPHGELTFAYNPQGQITSRGQKIGPSSINFGQAYTYDNQGRLTGISYPAGVSVGYGYLHGRLSAMTARIAGTDFNVATGVKYQPFGPMTGWSYGNGLTRTYAFDQNAVVGDRRLTGVVTKNGATTLQSMLLAYNSHNEISKITNYVNTSLTRDYVYDAMGRLTKDQIASNHFDSYGYDANGNRAATGGVAPGVAAPPMTYHTAIDSNRLTAVKSNQFTYDAKGNTSSGWGNSYVYNPFNRLTRAVNASGTHDYWINALGQRTWKRTGSSAGPTYGFTYGPSGQADTEYAWATNKWTHYLRLPDGQPIAIVRNNQLHMIHVDHLGRPEIVTNSAKAVVWRANNYSFDRTITLDAIGGLNLGFPGQYRDEESGLWYNYFRSYDPRTGRYIESDPIGLSGGLNTYAYVNANPIGYVDPFGLRNWPKTFVSVGNAVNAGRLYANGALRIAAGFGMEGTGVGALPGAATIGYGTWNILSAQKAAARARQQWVEAACEDSSNYSRYDTIKTFSGLLPWGTESDDPNEPVWLDVAGSRIEEIATDPLDVLFELGTMGL